METMTQSIEAQVPAAFANEEWTEYMFRSFYSERPAASDEFGEGTVRFEPAGQRSTKVTVEVQYRPTEEAASGADLARARDHLGRTLEAYRSFVVERCEETDCWIGARRQSTSLS
jgi:hypothetical protein